MAQNKMASAKKSSKDATHLKMWFFRFYDDSGFKVTVDGYIAELNADGEEILRNWGTSEITKRIHGDLLETTSGKLYKLEGPLDEKAAKRIGLPSSLIARFRNGFPQDWNNILREYYDVFRATNPMNASHWYENTYGGGRSASNAGDNRRSSISRESRRKSVVFADEPNEEDAAARRRSRSRLSVAPTVPAVIEENTLDLEEGGKDKENTPKNKALVGLVDGEGGQRRSPRLSAICDTPATEIVGQKAKEGEKSSPMATLEVVETPRRGAPPSKTVQKSSKLVIEEDALADDSLPIRGSKSTLQKKDSPVASKSPTVHETPSKKTPRGRKPAVEKEPTPAPKSTPRRRSAGDSETTPALNATPRRSARASVAREVTPAPASKSPKKIAPRSRSGAPAPERSAQEQTEKEAKAVLIDTQQKKPPVIAQSTSRQSARASSVAFTEPEPLASLYDDVPPPQSQNPDDSVFKVPRPISKIPVISRSSSIATSVAGGKKVLVDWFIRFLPSCEGKMKGAKHPPFTLAGTRIDLPANSEVWHTNIITRVVENPCSSASTTIDFTFYTISGSAYGITGEINCHDMAIEGFSKQLTSEFYDGFPADWIDWLQEAYRKKKDEIAGVVAVSPQETTHKLVAPKTGGREPEPIVTHPSSDSESRASVAFPAKNKVMNRKKSQSMADISNLSVVPFDKRRLSTGSNGEIVKTSSRGRTIKERMRVRYSDRGEVLGVENISIHETVVDPFAEHYAFPHSSQNRRLTAQPPRLSIEMDGQQQRVQPKKRIVDYDSSSASGSDDDVVFRTMQAIDYNRMEKAHRPGAKRSRVEEEESDEEKRILARIDRKEKKAQRELAVLRKARLGMLNKREKRKERRWRQIQMAHLDQDYERKQYALEQKLRAQKQAEKQRYLQHLQQQQQLKKRPQGRPSLSSQKKKKRSVVVEEDSSDGEDSVGFEGIDDGSSDDVSEESSTTETEVSDGGEWERTPAQKKRAVKRVKTKKTVRRKKPVEKRRKSRKDEDDEEEEEESEEEESDEDVFEETSPVVREPKEPKQKKLTWRQDDLDRLKLALKAMKVRSDADWEKISSSLGLKFPAADCHEMAVKKLKWKAPVEETKEKAEIVVTARKGTQAYQVQADQQTRRYMMGGGSQEDDYYRNENTTEDGDEVEMPNVAEFDPDDSLLEALKTPTVMAGAGRKGASRKPFIPAPLFGDDTPIRNTRRSSAIGINPDEPGSADRENHQRYLHHLMQQDKARLNNTSRMNNTSMLMNTTAADRSRAVDRFSKKLERIEKATKQQTKKKQREFDEEDEDEMEDDDC